MSLIPYQSVAEPVYYPHFQPQNAYASSTPEQTSTTTPVLFNPIPDFLPDSLTTTRKASPVLIKEVPHVPAQVVAYRKEGTSLHSSSTVSTAAVSLYLEGSPLQPFAERIATSPYATTLLGICTIEQYSCQRPPSYSPFNFWGMMKNGQVIRYSSQEEAILAVETLLDKAFNSGRTTIEQLNGWYVYPASPTWLATVLRVKKQLEN